MMETLYKLLKDFYRLTAGIGVYIIPGIFLLEIVYNKGFFGEEIKSIYDFILYFIWAIIFGLPFHAHQPTGLSKLTALCIKGISNPNFNEALSDEIELCFIFLKILVFFLLYKFIIWQSYLQFEPIFGISPKTGNLIISIIITLIVAEILIYPYSWYMKRRLI